MAETAGITIAWAEVKIGKIVMTMGVVEKVQASGFEVVKLELEPNALVANR